jgi:autotransporter-associated beta strand protein
MKHRLYGFRMLPGILALLVPASVSAQTLLDDPFTDGSRSNATGGDTSGAVWFSTGPLLTVADDSAGIGTGNALRFDGNAFSKLMAFFQPVTLAAVGQTLSLSFDYRFTVAPSSTSDFRVGLGNSNNTRQTADGGSTIRHDDWNYGYNTNPGLVGSNTRLCQEPAGDDTLGGNGAGQRIPIGTAGAGISSATTKHTAQLKITRQIDGSLSLQSQIDTEVQALATHPVNSVLGYTFDEVLIGYGNTTGTVFIDNVRLTLTLQNGVSITATDAAAAENGLDPGSFTVTRSITSGALSLPYNVSGTATAGADYQPLSGSVEFADGQGTAAITVTPLEDWFVESSETITVTLSPPSGTAASPASATVNLADNPTQTIPSDALFFSKLDLTRPGLEAVQTAVAANNFPAARSALASYFRARNAPVFPTPAFTPNATQINNALQHKYTITGVTYDFEPEPVTTINWSFNPTNPVNNEWPWQLNRHDWWDDLARQYQISPATNAAYLNEFLFELNDWITTSPVGDAANNQAGSRWRTIEAGIRTLSTWPASFYRLKSYPALSDDLLVLWVKSFYMHGRHLQKFTAGSGNWVAIEQLGLFTIGTIFPEFIEAASWRALAVTRMETFLINDVYPDGAEVELAPGYHDLVIGDIEGMKSLAAANGLPTSPIFDSKLEALYAYEMWVSEPNRNIPFINDSWDVDVKSRLGKGFAVFPHRTDFQWINTGGTSGTVPDHTSHLFPDAGQVVMRSGWSTTDSYLLMDAGPPGTGHQHEDKLSINVDGYGTRHVIDCGPYDYDTSAYRTVSLGSHSNSQPLVDDLDQNRLIDSTLHRNPTPITWRTTPQYDYAAASYGEDSREGWGPSRARPAVTRRHLFFMKPDVWVVIDAFKALDAASHTYSGIFHCSDDAVVTDAASQRVTVQLLPGEFDPYSRTTVTSAKPSLTITPLATGGQTLQVVKGQDSPTIFGYQFEKDTTYKKQPIPSVRYNRTVTGDTQMAYVLAAAPAAGSPRTPTITRAVTASDTYGVTMSFGAPNDSTTFLIGLDGIHTSWKGITYTAPSLVVTSAGVYDWAAEAYVQTWDGNGNASNSGNWSSAPNWDGDVAAPTTGNIANLANTEANRTVVYDSGTSGTLGTLNFEQSSAFSNSLEVRKNLAVTNSITLGSGIGTARIHILPASTADINLTANVTADSGGLLSLGAFNPAGVATVNVGKVTGNVSISGGKLELSDVVKQGTMVAGTTTTNTVTGDLTISGGAITFANTGYSDRRLQLTGNLNISGGTVSADNPALAAGFYLTGASNVMNATSFEAAEINMVLQALGNQSLSTSNNLGVIVARGSGTKTFTTSLGNIAQIQIMDGTSSAGVGTTFKLGSHVTASISPSSNNFGNTAEAGRIDLGIDTNGYVLSLIAASGWTANASSQATNTVWNLSGSGGAIQANTFNFATAAVTTNLAANTMLAAVGGSSTVTNLGGTGTIDPNSIFRYSGTAISVNPAILTSNRDLGDLEVTSGALKMPTNSTGTVRDLRVSGGTLDLDASAGRSFATISLTGGTLTNGTYATDEPNYIGLQTGAVSGNLTGAKQLIKNTGGTLILSGRNDHTGNTIVDAGTLHLAASGRLKFILGAASGSSNVLSGAGTVILDGAFEIDPTAAASLGSGTWTLENVASQTGSYGSTFSVIHPDGSPWTNSGNDTWTTDGGNGRTWTYDETTGILTLVSVQISAYGSWASGPFANPFTNSAPLVDFDNDGLSNLLEFVLGGDPTATDPAPVTPTASTSGDNLLLTFKRSDASELQPVTVKVQISEDPAIWDAVSDITIGAGPNGTGPGGATYTVDDTGSLDTIVVTIPTASATRKFIRVKASD